VAGREIRRHVEEFGRMLLEQGRVSPAEPSSGPGP
jgi:hypothetical protein